MIMLIDLGFDIIFIFNDWIKKLRDSNFYAEGSNRFTAIFPRGIMFIVSHLSSGDMVWPAAFQSQVYYTNGLSN